MVERHKKRIKELWDDIDVPVVILVVWAIVNVFFRVDDLISNAVVYQVINWGITLVVFGSIGYSLSQKKRSQDAVRAGAYAGIIVGLVGAVASIIAFYVMPELFAEQINNAIESGASEDMVKLFVQVGLYAGLIIAPLISGVVGAFSSWIGAKISKKK